MVSQDVYVDEKQPLIAEQQPPPHMLRPSRYSILRRFISSTFLICAILFLFRSTSINHGESDRSGELLQPPFHTEEQDATAVRKVALEAHIMSKCPDAKDCLQQLVVPAMVRVSDKVDFMVSYIGKIDNDSDAVSCMHGPGECLGNIIELCVARLYPDPKISLGFTNCMTMNYSQVPDKDLVQYCSLEHGVDFDQVNDCISDEGDGTELLRKSVLRSQEYNVTKSCTVRLAGEIRCIRDGGKWYDCPGGSSVADLVRDIEKLYKEDAILSS